MKSRVNCSDPTGSLIEMFIEMVQQGRIDKGQCPALRPVFLKPHGVASGTFTIRDDIPDELRHGLFAGSNYPVWARFSSDTVPQNTDYKSTLGIGLKLFNTPTPKIFGAADENTFDFILQNMDVFFVDTATDMCEFTRAGVVEGDYDSYLKAHPVTADILDQMAKPVASCLASPYWSGLPFSLTDQHTVKYKLEPLLDVPPPAQPPTDPAYLAQDMAARLQAEPARFRFMVQLQTDPTQMPVDHATTRWPESLSPYIPVADIEFPVQDINIESQVRFGENLSFNIWRVTEQHKPLGSIAEVRRDVYAASSRRRHDVNGIPDAEPRDPELFREKHNCVDDVIVSAAIHPAIGVARVGNAESEYFVGPETVGPQRQEPEFYRDSSNALKRQAARFRLYGLNAAGEVVRELTPNNANIQWQVHLANKKADWFQFIKAMDIPEAGTLKLKRRNPEIKREFRDELIIDPGARTISGPSESGKDEYRFDTGQFKGNKVYLGEVLTDENGRLLVLGGRGHSASPGGAPPFDPADPATFNNASDWFDDTSDGSVDATVTINGQPIPVEGAWVLVAPPNYAPDIVGWRTMHDLMEDLYIEQGWLPVPETSSFVTDILPILQRLSGLQWVNKGFHSLFGTGGSMDFNNPVFLGKLSQLPAQTGATDTYQSLRRQLLHAFRPYDSDVNEPRLWPSLYGDDYDGNLKQESPRTLLALPAMQQLHLQRWVAGDFIDDLSASTDTTAANSAVLDLKQVPLHEQAAMLDKSALHYCLADAFHPGCEMTWPMRHATLYSKPYRIRRRTAATPEPVHRTSINQAEILSLTGPLHEQSPGDLTRWMGLPWQGDTAYCRAGYEPEYDPLIPAFWPARVPNTVLTYADYEIAIDKNRSRDERLAAYSRRASWYEPIDRHGKTIAERMQRMIEAFGAQGLILALPGVDNDPELPAVMYVENIPAATLALLSASQPASDDEPDALESGRSYDSVWLDDEDQAAARALRARQVYQE